MSFRSVTSVFSGLKQWYSEINSATLTGAIDVIVVEQDDGTFISSPFHVRFGKLGVLKAKEKIVDIEVNGLPVDIHMKLDDNGAAFFVEDLDESEELPPELATSPLPNPEADEPPKWDEASREAVNRSLLEEFDNDTTDDASVLNKKQNKSKRKKKTRSKHSRSGSKASLKEIFSEPPQPPQPQLVASSTPNIEANIEVTSTSLLLSRLPQPEDLDSLVKDAEASEASEAEKENKGSLPIDIERKLQYFSEPEISPGTSPMGSRPGSPVMSDTEFETGKRGSVSGPSGGQKKASEAEQSWEWGQLPSSTTPQHSKDGLKKDKKDAKEGSEGKKGGWGISDYLFGRNSKQNVAAKTASEAQGVYLDDLKDDEEMLKIYLGSRTRSNTISKDVDNEDAESGNGPSLPMSPHSVEGAIGFQPQSSEAADLRGHGPNVEISLCGNDPNLDFSSLLFEQSKMSFDDFLVHLEECPQLLNNPGLVVRIGDGPQFYKWEVAAPMIMSHVLYGRSLPQDLIEKLKNGGQGKKDLEKSGSVSAPASASSSQERKSSWWPFGSRKENEDALTSNKMEKMEEGLESTPMEAVEAVTEAAPRKRRNDTTSSSEAESETERLKSERCKKTLRLTSELIKCLNLKKGANEIQFSVTTAYQGTTRCLCHVYLWHHSDKIVISDIDGTITKSDVLGHVFPMIGRDWAQSGVASLFTKIVNNGYHIVYLSARAIGQAAITKDYLASIKQGEVNLPDGPIFLNPTSLVNAFHREVIEKKPEEFKIACLRDIRKLFPDDKNPFYAGYGNRVNDVWAYQAVGIPMSRIFTINPKGELRHELTNAFQTSYGSMSNIVDHVFPPTDAHSSPSMALGYSNFTFWREPLPRITPEEENAETPQLALAGPEASPEDKSKESSPLAGPEASNAKETNSDSSSSSSSSQTTVVETIQNVEKINP